LIFVRISVVNIRIYVNWTTYRATDRRLKYSIISIEIFDKECCILNIVLNTSIWLLILFTLNCDYDFIPQRLWKSYSLVARIKFWNEEETNAHQGLVYFWILLKCLYLYICIWLVELIITYFRGGSVILLVLLLTFVTLCVLIIIIITLFLNFFVSEKFLGNL